MTAGLFDLTGRVAIVTGASSGLGARFVRVLNSAGARVVVAARRLDRIEALARELGAAQALALQVDVRHAAAVASLVDRAVDHFGRLDVMVNNAGVSDPGPAEEESTDTFREVLDVNLGAVFSGCREAARVMLPRGSGCIVNVASAMGLLGSWRIPSAGYAASKGGVINLTRDLASQWARRGVRVNAIAPGWFESEMTAPLFEGEENWQRHMERTVPAGRAGREGELDGALLFLASDASSYVTGQTLVVDGGWTVV
jgi:NAD(P)-dependent dehydrogenase (short-subunit alcohol dehydrogenase family)